MVSIFQTKVMRAEIILYFIQFIEGFSLIVFMSIVKATCFNNIQNTFF